MTDTIRGTDEDIDVLVIGSGPAGSTYARTIGDALPTARTLMVEVGPAVPGRRGDHTLNMTETDRITAQLLTQGPDAGIDRAAALAAIAPGGVDPSLEFRHTILPGLFFVDPRPKLPDGEVGLPAASMSSGVGGMGIHWSAYCPRPRRSERIPLIPGDELDAALDHAENLLGVTRLYDAPGLLGAMRRAMADEFDGPGLTPVGFLPTATHRDGDALVYSGTGVILGDLEQTVPGFELRPETLARRILTEHGAAVGAELEDRRSGEVYQVRVARVVVCADGLRTPQLLFASGIRPPALGHYLNEHFQMASVAILNEEFGPVGYPADQDSRGKIFIPFSDARPMQGTISPVPSSAHKLWFGDDLPSFRFALLQWFAAKDIQFSDAIEFSETETDFYGMPKMFIRYSHTRKDLATIEAMRENFVRSSSCIGRLLGEAALAAGGSSLHYQGTVRMGAADDGTSVCDPYLRVWAVGNLYVGGNGVIPTATVANPTLTTVALAWRAASQLARELGTERFASTTAP